MKSLKGILVLGIAVMSFGAMAQDKEAKKVTPEQKAKKMSQKLQKELSLNDDQTKKLEAVNLKMINKKKILQAEKEALKTKSKALNEERKTEYKSILTADQYKKLEEMVQARKEQRKEKKGPHKGHGPRGGK